MVKIFLQGGEGNNFLDDSLLDRPTVAPVFDYLQYTYCIKAWERTT